MFCPGGFCPGGFCLGVYVQGFLSGGFLSLVPTTMVTIMTDLPLIVLELYKNIAKCTLTCVIIDQIDAIVLKLFYNLFLRRNNQSQLTVN